MKTDEFYEYRQDLNEIKDDLIWAICMVMMGDYPHLAYEMYLDERNKRLDKVVLVSTPASREGNFQNGLNFPEYQFFLLE